MPEFDQKPLYQHLSYLSVLFLTCCYFLLLSNLGFSHRLPRCAVVCRFTPFQEPLVVILAPVQAIMTWAQSFGRIASRFSHIALHE